MTEVFAALDGISPWWWVVAALILGAVELLTGLYVLLWFALTAASVALCLWVAPDLPGTAQAAIFALLLPVYAVAVWRLFGKYRRTKDKASGLNDRAAAMIGRRAIVVAPFVGESGAVEIDGVRWRGRLSEPCENLRAGSELTVAGADGMTLLLERP